MINYANKKLKAKLKQRVRKRTLAPSAVAKATSSLFARVRILAEHFCFYRKFKIFYKAKTCAVRRTYK